MVWIKICGITCIEDARLAAEFGADAIGINLVPTSKRRVDVSTARAIAAAVRDNVTVVGVVADASLDEMRGFRTVIGLDLLQLHGSESAETLQELLPGAFKATRIEDESDVEHAATYRGQWLLVDAKSPGGLGGTGHRFDWSLVRELAARRPLILAGGLTPENVAGAIQQVQPFGIDVASGVEIDGQPRRKHAERMRRFIEAGRQ
jgi:phosphoribosylanthranilate isomerase